MPRDTPNSLRNSVREPQREPNEWDLGGPSPRLDWLSDRELEQELEQDLEHALEANIYDGQLFVSDDEGFEIDINDDPFSDANSPSVIVPQPAHHMQTYGTRQESSLRSPSNDSQPLRYSPDPFGDLLDLSPAPAPLTIGRPRVVDLTEDSPEPEMPPVTRKRKAPSPGEGPAKKTTRLAKAPRGKQEVTVSPEDVVDLSGIEEGEEYKDFKRKQQEELIKQQQKEEAIRPVRLAEFQCIICMDSPTDLTVTHCGHLFCAECLFQALHADRAKKNCPVCRQTVVVNPPGRKPVNKSSFPLAMKLMTAKKKGKQRAKV